MSAVHFSLGDMLPRDEYNRQLLAQVHPPDWVNPIPKNNYDLVVIGAGTAGLVVAAGAAGLDVGLKVALVEKHLLGGDCLNVGCVPSKSLLSSARVVGVMQKADPLGVKRPDTIEVNFPEVMARMRKVRAGISKHDSVARFRDLGVDVFLGAGRFLPNHRVEVGPAILPYKKAVIATGARPRLPTIPGLEEVGFLTNETVFSLTQCPQRLAVIGGGPLGCELAQALQRLGAKVTLFHRGAQLLNKEDGQAGAIVQSALRGDGVELVLDVCWERMEKTEAGKVLHFSRDGQNQSITVDEILVAVGRLPNVEGLNLENVGVDFDRQGVKVNDYLQTTNPKIYAAGDVCLPWQFTHAADAAARLVIKNALFSPGGLGRSRLSSLVMPWVTYTDPEVAQVGITVTQAQSRGWAVNTLIIPFHGVERAIVAGETEGFLKIIHKPGSDQILGATIVATQAGEMISEITTAMVNKIGLSKLSNVIHPYPTQAEAIKKAADAYRRNLLTPKTKLLLSIVHRFS